MNSIQESERAVAYKYEAVFCIFLAIMAYLGRENANLVYPTVLHFFLLLLSLNFSAILALRLWPSQEWFSALIILANCGVITGILSYSGGPESNLWVLYLLPIYTVSLLLSGREVAWITIGAVSFNTIFYFVSFNALSAATIFELCLKNGVFVFSAALTWRLAGAERRSLGQLRRQREELDRLDEKTRVQAAHDEQTEQLAAVGLISAGIVHDLKSPLMVIRGFTDICLQEKSLDSSIRRDLGSIRRATLRCQDLVAGILSAAKKEDTPRVECEIHELIESAVEFCGNMFADAGIDLEKKFNRHHLRVLGHPEQLERILLNLLGNAVKAMPSGGALTIRTKTDCMKDGRSRIMVLVEDTGTGISDEAMTNLFKPFSTTRPLAGGTGLGLYLSRDIAVKHGGSLQAENAPTGGARFTLTLPMETAPAREAVALRI
ncbi:MAG: HAMP domain-containing sensor histidine kinase [Elusimicrobiota bacterium]|mgnify:CR=1 FL=1